MKKGKFKKSICIHRQVNVEVGLIYWSIRYLYHCPQKNLRSFSFIFSQHFVSLCGNSKPHENGL